MNKELCNERIEQLIDLGFEIEENMLVHKNHDVDVVISSLGMFKEDSYNFFLQALVDEQKKYSLLEKKEQRLFSDKKQIENSLKDFRGFLANVKNAETIEFMQNLNSQLNDFIQEKLTELKTI